MAAQVQGQASDDGWMTTLFNKIIDAALNGTTGFCSAEALVVDYRNTRYASMEHRVDAIISYESGKTFGTGFTLGLGGLTTLPVTVTGSIVANYTMRARLIAAIAILYGRNLAEEEEVTLVKLLLIGEKNAISMLSEAGVQGAGRLAAVVLTKEFIKTLPNTILRSINKMVGARLFTKYGATGIVRLMSYVPLAGGLVSGALDYSATLHTGKEAKGHYSRAQNAILGSPRTVSPPISLEATLLH